MRARFAAGFFDAAARAAHALLRVDDAHGEAHVTLARVHLAEGGAREPACARPPRQRLFSSRNRVVRVVSANCRAAEGDAAGRSASSRRPWRCPGSGTRCPRGRPRTCARYTKQFGAHLCRRPRGRRSGVRAALASAGGRRRRARRGAGSRRLRGDLRGGFGDGRAVPGHGPGGRARARALNKVTPSSPHYPAAALLADVHSKRGDNAASCGATAAGRAPASGRLVSRAAGGGVPPGGPAASCRLRPREGCGARPNDAQIARSSAPRWRRLRLCSAVACCRRAETREENAIRARSAPRRGRFEKTERLDSGNHRKASIETWTRPRWTCRWSWLSCTKGCADGTAPRALARREAGGKA